MSFTRVELKTAPPIEQVFRIAEAAERVDYRERLDAFLAAVGSSQVSISSIESVLTHVRSMNLSDDEVKLAEEVLTAATQGELK